MLDVAVRTACDVGLGNLVHAEIARAGDVSIGTVFGYFPDAESLVTSAVGEVGRFYREQCDRFLKQGNPSRDDLRHYAGAFVASVDSHPHYAAVFLQWAAAVGNEHGVWDMFLKHNQYLVRKIRHCLETDSTLVDSGREHLAESFAQLYLGSAFVIIRLKFSGAGARKIRRFLQESGELYSLIS